MAKGSQSTMAKPVTGPSSTKSDVAQGFCMHMSGLVRDKCAGDGISLVLPVFGAAFFLSAWCSFSARAGDREETHPRSEMHGNGYKPLQKRAAVCLAK